ncbi:MAG: DUF5702 domain-containing protein [Lachnospiraceae bacterium]|nr:DUF5702 domain-containing protein [Lachnospiraceae bacterium]
MDRTGEKGSITVFLSLICILFLALFCTVTESARVQGARAQTANIAGMGNFSVLGEFEKELLDQYEIFALDGGYGTGNFGTGKVNDRLKTFLLYNAEPEQNIFSVWCFDPWKLELEDSQIQKYALLTDEKGEPFFQQAVSFMKLNLGVEAINALIHHKEDVSQIESWQEEYEKRKKENEKNLSNAEREGERKLQELTSAATSNAGAAGETEALLPEQPDVGNPLEEIAKLRRRSILSIVTGNSELSSKSMNQWSVPSHGISKRGTMKVEKKNSGLTADLLFREYLLTYFPNYTDSEGDGCLDYQIEYIISGKAGDQKNLKSTVNRLLLLREGMNYLYCVENAEMSTQAGALAITLTGFLGIPALTSATKHALLLAWAYGESLLDLRKLLAGGKVPLLKDGTSWTLTLENLGQLTQLLDSDTQTSGSGLAYKDYLRILLNMGSLSKQKMRALDLIQENLRKTGTTEKFKAENCIVGIETSTSWKIRPVFFSLAQAVTGVRGDDIMVTQNGGMVYE